jgi:ABC-type methionine transport system ATPase subunit
VIIRLNREINLTVMLVEQNVSFVRRAAHRCAMMEKGRVVEAGAISDLTDAMGEGGAQQRQNRDEIQKDFSTSKLQGERYASRRYCDLPRIFDTRHYVRLQGDV